MGLNRRDFLGLAGGAGVGLGLAQLPIRRLVGLNDLAVHESQPGIEQWVRTSCQICSGGCGMEARLVDGQPVNVRGNPLHPVSRGGLCAVGAGAMHYLYHPDRIRSPLQGASGARPHQEWKGVSWDDALGDLAGRIKQLQADGKADRIFLVDGSGPGLMSRLAMEFMNTIGSPNYFLEQKSDPIPAGMQLAQGIHQAPAYDLENASTVLSFGVPILEGWESPVHGNRIVGAIRKASAENRSRAFIQIDVRGSRSADRADHFFKVKPGGFGATALAMAYVLISQKLYDRDYVEAFTSGFEDWTDEKGGKHLGFKNYVLRYCRPKDLENVTGLSGREILEIAKDFGTDRPSVAIVDQAATSMSNGMQTAFAVQALNALVGAIDQPGGAGLADPVPLRPFPGENAEEALLIGSGAEGGLFRPALRRDAEDLLQQLAQDGEEMELLFLLNADPFTSIPRGDRFENALGNATVVSFSPLPDTTTRLADLVLPDTTFFERWQDSPAPQSFPNAVFGVTRPVIEPMYQTRPSGDVLLDLAARVHGSPPPRLPWTNFESLLKSAALGLFEARRGSTFTSEREASEIREMERRGWWIPDHEDEDSLWEGMLETGGWWDPYYQHGMWSRVFHTSDKKFNFFARDLYQLVTADDALEHEVAEKMLSLGIREPGDPAFMPHLEDPKWFGETGEDSFHMHLAHPLVPSTAVASNLPWVREVLNDRVAWDAWVEMHEEDGHRLGLHEGDMVKLSVGDRSIEVRMLLSHRVQPGLVMVPRGIGRADGGRWAARRGANPLNILAPDLEAVSGCLQVQSTKIRVEKINSGDQNV